MMLTDVEIRTLIDRIAAELNPQRVIIFGSYAKGTATPRSDLNIAVEMATMLPADERSQLIDPIIDGYLVPIAANIYTTEEVTALGSVEFSLMHSILTTGRVVYARASSKTVSG
jgi:predicted nucleotidyltransferase